MCYARIDKNAGVPLWARVHNDFAAGAPAGVAATVWHAAKCVDSRLARGATAWHVAQRPARNKPLLAGRAGRRA